MKISFAGNHLYLFSDIQKRNKAAEIFYANKRQTKRPIITYADENFVHVIDGKEGLDFFRAWKQCKSLGKEPSIFNALTQAYRETATLVDFSHIDNLA